MLCWRAPSGVWIAYDDIPLGVACASILTAVTGSPLRSSTVDGREIMWVVLSSELPDLQRKLSDTLQLNVGLIR